MIVPAPVPVEVSVHVSVIPPVQAEVSIINNSATEIDTYTAPLQRIELVATIQEIAPVLTRVIVPAPVPVQFPVPVLVVQPVQLEVSMINDSTSRMDTDTALLRRIELVVTIRETVPVTAPVPVQVQIPVPSLVAHQVQAPEAIASLPVPAIAPVQVQVLVAP